MNLFDQFDRPATNPFDQFDAPDPAQTQADTRAKVAAMHPLERAMHAVGKTGADITNFGRRSYNTVADYVDPLDKSRVEQQDEAIAAQKPFYDAILETPEGLGANVTADMLATAFPGGAAYKVATALPKLATAGVKIVNGVRQANMAGKVARGAIGGAAAGATGETLLDRSPETGAEFGAVLGTAGPPLGYLGGKLVDQGRRFIGGAKGAAIEAAQGLFKGKTDAAIKALRQARPTVPGEVVTVGQAVTPELQEFAALEKGARSRPNATEFTKADAQTAAARNVHLAEWADAGVRQPHPQTGKEMLSPVEQLRQEATQPFYDKAMPDQVRVTPQMLELFDTPGLRPKYRKGMDEWKAESTASQFEGGRGLPDGRYDEKGVPTSMSISQLQKVVQSLRKTPFGAPEYFAAKDAASELTRRMEDASKPYAEAQAYFKEMSGPVNQSKIVGALRDSLNKPTAAGEQSPEAYLKLIRDTPELFRQAGTPDYVKTMPEAFKGNPEAWDATDAVARSAQRSANYNAGIKEQSILKNYESPFNIAARESPHTLMQSVTIARSLLRSIGRRSDAKVTEIIDRAAANAPQFAKLLEGVPPAKQYDYLRWLAQQGAKINPGTVVAPTVTQLRKME